MLDTCSVWQGTIRELFNQSLDNLYFWGSNHRKLNTRAVIFVWVINLPNSCRCHFRSRTWLFTRSQSTQSIPILANSQSHLFSLKRPETRPETVFWKVMGSTPVGELRNIFSEQFDMRTLLHSKSILFPPWNGLTTEYYDFPYSTWSYNIFDKETVLFVIGLKKNAGN